MVRVPALRMRPDHDAWAQSADLLDDRSARHLVRLEVSVAQPEVRPDRNAEDARRSICFARPRRRIAARSRLPARRVDNPDAEPRSREPRDRTAGHQLGVVRVSADHEHRETRLVPFSA